MEILKRALLLAFVLCALPAWATNCPTSVPGSYPGTQGSTTPTVITGTSCTINGVTDSVSSFWGVEYNHSVCPYSAGSGGNQSTCDLLWVGPTGAITSPNNYETIFIFHGGGGSAGTNGELGNGDPFGVAGVPLTAVQMVQQYMGTPNAVGGKGIVLILVNYRLTAAGTPGTSTFPAQWQDAKCALWHVLANSTTFPGNKSVIGVYGASWGGTMSFWLANTADTAYTTSCDSSAPGTPPAYRMVASWPAIAWIYPFNNASFDNVTQTNAYKNAIKGQVNSTTEATFQTWCAAFSQTCDPANTITSGNAAVYKNVQALYQFGNYGNSCATADCLVMPYWNTLGVTTGTTGGAAGGNLYNTATNYAAAGVAMPYMQILEPNCFHVCDTTTFNSPSERDAFNFLLNNQQTPLGNAGLGGNL